MNWHREGTIKAADMSQECLALRGLQYGVIWVTHRF
jgi:hypothetical protein